jgi:site-specific DNA recombinase
MNNKKIRAIGYTRVSTDRQAEEGYSLDAQKELLIKECKHKGWTLVDIFVEEGKSGGTLTKRPKIQKLLRRLKTEDIDYVIVYKVNRFSRRVADVVDMMKILKSTGTYLYAIEDRIDTSSSMGEAFLIIGSVFAEMERNGIIENVRYGMRNKAEKGEWCGGVAPFGYRLEKGKLYIDEEKAEIVKEIYLSYLKGTGYLMIAQMLNEKGYQTVRGNAFGGHAVRDILKNPVYAGMIQWGCLTEGGVNEQGEKKRRKATKEEITYVKGIQDAIISEEMFEEVQRRMTNNPVGYNRTESRHLLSGLLRCPDCGYGMSYHRIDTKGRAYDYYMCNNYRNKKICRPNMVRKDRVEKEFFDKLNQIMTSPTFIHSMKESVEDRDGQVADRMKRIKEFEKQMASLQSDKSSLIRKMSRLPDDLIDDMLAEISEMKKEEEELQRKIDGERNVVERMKRDSLNMEDITGILENAVAALSIIEDEQTKQRLLRKLIKEIHIKIPGKSKSSPYIYEIVFMYDKTVTFDAGEVVPSTEIQSSVSPQTIQPYTIRWEENSAIRFIR